MNPFDHLHAAKVLIAERTRRRETFGIVADAFGEPGWDMLLHLFVHSQDGRRAVAAEELRAIAALPAVAEAYLQFLASHGVIEIEDGGRRGVVTLEAKGAALMRAYLRGHGDGSTTG